MAVFAEVGLMRVRKVAHHPFPSFTHTQNLLRCFLICTSMIKYPAIEIDERV